MVIVQSERGKSGKIVLTATSGNLKEAAVTIQAKRSELPPIVQ
jgi:hypothetical protein